MKRYLLVIIIIGITFSNNVISQDTSIIKYLPLKVGNVWVYFYSYESYWYGNSIGYQKFQITGTTIHSERTYYMYSIIIRVIQGTNVCYQPLFSSGKHLRVDSLTGKVMAWESCAQNGQEYMVDSLNSRLHDSVNLCGNPYNRIVCADTAIQNIFNISKPSKLFTIQGVEAGMSYRYVKDFGITSANHGSLFYNCGIILRGCIIDGVLYGDTSMIVGIKQISSEVPKSFSLYQNYPNPFNPTTNIRFEIAELRFVNLKLYDVMGREIQTLVNEQLSPGTYEVEFDGTNYSSGVYYYKLFTDSYTETKKMMLIK